MTRTGRRTQRHHMNTWKKLGALLAVLAVLGGTGGYLYVKYGHGTRHPLTTTPSCLQLRNSFCTGVALREITREDLSSFTSTTGVFPSIVEYYQRFGRSFSVTSATQVAVLGARPLIQINPHDVSIAGIADGHYDTYLRNYAAAVKAFGHAVVLSFGHEMNGTWSTWSEPFTKPAVFIAAWRHIHQVFTTAKVKNVTWAWDVSHLTHGAKPPRTWWPGAKYVDWIGVDGYLRAGQSFAGQFYRSVKTLRKLARKPLLITETAVAPGPQQVKQIEQLFTGARHLHLLGLVWFDVNKQKAWQLEKNSTGLAEFKKEAK